MLHQFLAAETIQIPEESILLIFLVILFLSHSCNLPDSYGSVNANSKRRLWPPALSTIGNAQSLADRYGCVLKVRQARNQLQIFGDLLGMGEHVIGDHQHLAG